MPARPMNVSQIKALTWLTSVGLSAGLAWMVYDYMSTLPQRQARFDSEKARQVLEGVEAPRERRVDLVPAERVRAVFFDLNWTGKPKAKPVAPTVQQTEPERPRATPMADLVRVLFIGEDPEHPERSTCFLQYKPAARVPGTPTEFGESYRVGDSLRPPHDYATIERISATEGVVFRFRDPDREPEAVKRQEFEVQSGLVAVDGEPIRRGPSLQIPRGTVAQAFGPKTRQVGENRFRLGTEDIQDFAERYTEILAREVRHRRWINPQTKRPEGIELTSVEPGGVAARHGAQTGDIIKSINGHPVTSAAEAISFVKNHADEYTTWEIVVENMGRERTVIYESPPQE